MDRGLLQAYASTISLAILPIVMGSFGSLKTSKRSKRLLRERSPRRSKSKTDEDPGSDDEDEDDEYEGDVDRISFSDAWMFPILGSCMLGGLYLLFKYVDKIWINWFVGWYFTLAGVVAVFETSSTVLKWITPGAVSTRLPEYKIDIAENSKKFFSATLPLVSLASIPLSLAIPYVYATQQKPWWANNVLGFSFAHTAIQLMKLDSFITGATLLGGLFFYDIFWVFGTEVMVSVAKGLDAPVKLVFPKDPGMTGAQGYSMLGLGDIVIPGIFIALALRYDFSLASRRCLPKPLRASASFPKPYFLATMVAYVLGLVTTIGVMHTFRAAQPALLYLSPACVGAVALVALVKGEFALLWKWGDGDDDAEEVERAKKLKKENQKDVEVESDRESKVEGNEENTEEKVDLLGSALSEGLGTEGMRLRSLN
ncbi:Uncharacterized conserved protein [Phaffia rhodozyma]|uniref:Uncharacterized conserved protein n=1 Tax=Phaffia rhodozyma TaxID=264483 RepID=A0A0F7SYW4_PHARH|nr:Uncharacterized conserved protein [Phaffia rhodozyma]